MEAFKPILARLATGALLDQAQAEMAFDLLLSGEVSEAQSAAFLMALRLRGETITEIIGAVTAMRAKMLGVTAPPGAIDIVGTGGDGHGTYNVSTLAALLVAACGVPVAKHGNRAASSRSGASDVLTELGVKIGLEPDAVAACIKEAYVGFMSAQTHHPAMRHFAKLRGELGTRTIFNLLGPLCNPARVKYQLLGLYSSALREPLAEVLLALGSERVWLVHGSDGLDELTVTGPSFVTELDHGILSSFTLSPMDAGLSLWPLEQLKGGDPAANALALKEVLAGKKCAYRDIALFNAAASLVIAGAAENLRAGVEQAAEAIQSGKALATLDRLIEVSNRAEANSDLAMIAN